MGEYGGEGVRAEGLIDPELERHRLLTEVHHLQNARRADGTFDEAVVEAVFSNLITKTKEDAIEAAVSTTFQPRSEVLDVDGEHRVTYIWKGLGMTALGVATSGESYHASEPAFARVGVEKAEAKHGSYLEDGTMQCFISPRMTRKDAPYDVAKAEHLADEDAVRTYRAVKDENGRIIGRQTQSILVRDVPPEAWPAMLRSSINPWGRPIHVADSDSALSVMQIFDQLDIDEAKLPEGPVSLLAAVLPYIKDNNAYESVEQQLADLRQDQERLHEEAERTATEWIKFEKALADSLTTKIMSSDIERFVITLQCLLPKDIQQLLAERLSTEGRYSVDEKLAAKLEQMWQKVNLGKTAVAVGDKRSLQGVAPEVVRRLQENIQFMRVVETNGASPYEIQRLIAQQNRAFAAANIRTGSGCGGPNPLRFGNDNNLDPLSGEAENPWNDMQPTDESSEGVGEVHEGECRIPGCPNSSRKVKVGGCEVCLSDCQPKFDDNWTLEDIIKFYAMSNKEKTGNPEKQKPSPRTSEEPRVLGGLGRAVVIEAERLLTESRNPALATLS